MGERSDIFVRIRAKEKTTDKRYKHEVFFGLYYQWCYGERMISRLRAAIDFAHSDLNWRPCISMSKERIEKFKQVLRTNFDMRDIIDTIDLVPDAIDNLKQGYDTVDADIFNQAENHGFIYLDITIDDPDEKFGESTPKVKYAFVQNEGKEYPIMDVVQFADWDIGDGERKWYEPDPYWDKPEEASWGKNHKKDFLENVVPTCKNNIEAIKSDATLMTEKERKAFVKAGRAFVKKTLIIAESEIKDAEDKRKELLSEIFEKFHSYEKGYKDLLELVDKAYPKPAKE
jgi:hypothetical protein